MASGTPLTGCREQERQPRPVCKAHTVTDALDKQLQMNRETAQALRDSGVRDGQPLEVDAFFFAADEASASAPAAHLTAEGWRARTDAQKRGVLKKRIV